MTADTTLAITPAQAERELARRKAGKGTKKHAAYPKAHIMRASGADLRAVLAHEAQVLAENALSDAPVQVPVQAPIPEVGPFFAEVLPLVWVRVGGSDELLTTTQIARLLAS